jgi:lipid-A-disaccharide synthase
MPTLRVIVAGAPGIEIDSSRCPFPVVREQSFGIYRAADAAISKSGTNTLEAAVAGCPLVIGYRASAISYAIAKRVVTIPHISLVNIVAQREVARELLQDAMTPEALAATVAPLLDASSLARREQLAALAHVRDSLGAPGAAGRVAAMASAMVSAEERAR